MLVVVEVNTRDPEPPPMGSRVRVEVRDTSLADAPAVTLGRADGQVRGRGAWLETLDVEVEAVPLGTTAWAHVDVDGDGAVSRGDLLTTASYEVPSVDAPRVAVWLTRI
jgi:putative lipoprotein